MDCDTCRNLLMLKTFNNTLSIGVTSINNHWFIYLPKLFNYMVPSHLQKVGNKMLLLFETGYMLSFTVGNHCGKKCFYHGQCVERYGVQQCVCKLGWEGTNCSVPQKPFLVNCRFTQCFTSGTEYCLLNIILYECICKPSWKGVHCNQFATCHNHVCQNGGTCIVENSFIYCLCFNHTYGQFCENLHYSSSLITEWSYGIL